MALNEIDSRKLSDEVRDIEALASVLDMAIMIYDRNDTLVAASSQFLRFFAISPDLLQPGARLRDLFNATFDAGARMLGALNGKNRNISREDWIAERTAIHWREHYESVEQLPDGRWIQLRKRRMADGILIATLQDITEQKTKEHDVSETLRQAALVHVILDSLALSVIVKDSELRYLMVNDVFCRVFGLPRKKILGKRAADFVGPELAARFEKLENHVLETGEPYDALENIYSADGSTMKCVTRMRRSGTPGNFFVTVSFDNISQLADGGNVQPYQPEQAVDADPAAVPEASFPEPKGRILVLDEDSQRSAGRVIALKQEGFDAAATSSASETIAFLNTAKSMGLTISEVEISAQWATAMEHNAETRQHVVLSRAIEAHFAKATETVPVAAPSHTPPRVSGPPVLSVVPNTPSPDENNVAPIKTASPPAPAPKTQGADPVRDRVRVLVAEDNDVNQIVFEQILEGLGADFRIVNNGQEAVAAWRASAPDLILMDVSMPVMNGLQAVQAIRDAETNEADKAGRVPVIAVTAHAMGGDRERCLAAGMDDYLSKPVNPEKLEALIQKWVEGSERFQAAV